MSPRNPFCSNFPFPAIQSQVKLHIIIGSVSSVFYCLSVRLFDILPGRSRNYLPTSRTKSIPQCDSYPDLAQGSKDDHNQLDSGFHHRTFYKTSRVASTSPATSFPFLLQESPSFREYLHHTRHIFHDGHTNGSPDRN